MNNPSQFMDGMILTREVFDRLKSSGKLSANDGGMLNIVVTHILDRHAKLLVARQRAAVREKPMFRYWLKLDEESDVPEVGDLHVP